MDLSRGREVSLFFFPRGLQARFPESFECLREQVRTLQAIRHPLLVNVLSSGDEGEQFFFAEEKPRGETLLAVMQRKRERREFFTPEVALGLCWLLARSLSLAHRDGPHGFVNPQEIFLEPWPEGPIPFYPRLARAGIRTALRNSPLAFEELRFDMPGYAAPEFTRAGSLGPGTDAYALGAILYSLLTLRPPAGCFVPPTRLHPWLPRSLDRIVLRALEEDPQSRYESPDELAIWLVREGGADHLWAELARSFRELVQNCCGQLPVLPTPAPGAAGGDAAAEPLERVGSPAGESDPPAVFLRSRLGLWGSLLLLTISILLLALAGRGFLTGDGDRTRLSQYQEWESFFRGLEEEAR